MHPLTVTWAPNMYTDWGWKNQKHGLMQVLIIFYIHQMEGHTDY